MIAPDDNRLALARRELAKGRSLHEAARTVRLPAAELDVLLWRTVGQSTDPHDPNRLRSRDDRFLAAILRGAREAGLTT